MALRRFGKAMIEDNGFWAPKMAPASSEAPPTQRLGIVWRRKMVSKDASRAKENLHLDTYFTLRSGFETFRERYDMG